MRRGRVLVVAILGVLSMAPTVGDVGGCGREATELDASVFAQTKKSLDCKRCSACDLATARCQGACDPKVAPETVLPATCRPLLHDGEVCIRALNAASCGDYASYMDDERPTVPSECDFCRVPPPPTTTAPAFGEGGAP
jgi:hypothetical protein